MKNQAIEAEIERYNKFIEKNPNKHQYHALKANALEKINRLEEAIESYDQAIKLENGNRNYIAKRAKLYGLTGKADKALEDLKLIAQLPSDGDDFNNLVLSSILREVQKLESVNKKITELRDDKSINPSLLDAIEGLSSVAGTLTFKVGIHEERLGVHDGAIGELQTAHKQSMELIQKIQKSNSEELSKMRDEIQTQHLNALFAEAKYKSLEIRVMDLEDFKKKFPEQSMKFISKENEFAEFLKKYNSEEQSSLKDYINGFTSQCSVAYTAALVVKSGQFKLDTSNIYVSLGSKLISFIPYIGETTSSVIDFLWENIESTKISAKVDNIVKYAPSAYIFETHMRYVLINSLMNDEKSQIVINKAEEKSKAWYQKIQATYKQIELAIKDKIQENKALQVSTLQYKLGVKDANELLETFLLSGKALELPNQGLDAMTDSLLCIENLHLEVGNNDSTVKEPDIKDQGKVDGDVQRVGLCEYIKNCCTIFSVKEILYDNELLNNPEILKLSVKEFGMSKVLDMSSSLSFELIAEAIEQNNAELLLAGCMSLNYYDAV